MNEHNDWEGNGGDVASSSYLLAGSFIEQSDKAATLCLILSITQLDLDHLIADSL